LPLLRQLLAVFVHEALQKVTAISNYAPRITPGITEGAS